MTARFTRPPPMPLMLEIPDSTVATLQLSPEDLRKELRRDLAVALYARGALPVGKALELAGLTRREFEGLLKAREVGVRSMMPNWIEKWLTRCGGLGRGVTVGPLKQNVRDENRRRNSEWSGSDARRFSERFASARCA